MSKRIFVGFLSLAMALSLTACGNTAKTPDDPNDANSDVVSVVDDSSVASDVADDTVFATVKEFIEDPSTQEALESSLQGLADPDMFDVAVTGTDDSLIYKFTFTESAMEDVDESLMISQLEDGLADNAEVFSNIATSLTSVTTVAEPKCVVVYARPDGSTLVEKTYDGSSAVTLDDTQSGNDSPERDE